MMTSRISFLAVGAFALITAGVQMPLASAANQEKTPEKKKEKKHKEHVQEVLPHKHLDRAPVEGKEGKKLGEVFQVVIDKDQADIRYAAVSVEKGLVAVPWAALHISHKDGHYKLSLDLKEEEFKKAPTFKKEDWPATPDEKFWVESGAMPKPERVERRYRPEGPAITTDGLKGMPVHSKEGKELGKAETVSFDIKKGKLNYVLIPGEAMSEVPKGELVVAPWEIFEIKAKGTGDHLTLRVPTEKLAKAPTVPKDHLEELASPELQEKVKKHYEK